MSGTGAEPVRENLSDAAIGGLLGDAVLRLELCKEADFLRVFPGVRTATGTDS